MICDNMKLARRTVLVAVVVLLSLSCITTRAEAQTNDLQPLSDLLPETEQPTDNATALLKIVPVDETHTVLSFQFEGIVGEAGKQLRADFHRGPCVDGDVAAAGAHFNTTGEPPEVVDNTTEVWIDFTIPEGGANTVLLPLFFTIPSGAAQSVVIHERDAAQPNSTGAAWACQPIAILTDEQLVERAETALGQSIPDEVLGLAITGSSLTEVLAVVGGALVVAGAITVQTASAIRRRENE